MASYNQMKTESSKPTDLHFGTEQGTGFDVDEDLIQILKQKIQHHSNNKINQSIEIDVDAYPENSKENIHSQSFEWESSNNDSNDEDYIPEIDSSQSESVSKYRIHNLRIREIKVITKLQFQKRMNPNEPIEIDDDIKPEINYQKHENIKINFKEEMRGRITKKTKMEYLLKNKGIRGLKARNQKIRKSLKKLAKQLQ